MFCCIYTYGCIVFFFLHWIFTKLSRKGLSLKSKHVCITGGSEGIGFAIAKHCTQKGAALITLVARNQEKLQKSIKELNIIALKDKQIIQGVSCDVSNTKAVQKLMDQLTGVLPIENDESLNIHWIQPFDDSKMHPLDCLINSAGLCISDYLENFTDEDIRQIMDVNVVGSIVASRAVFAQWKKQDLKDKKAIVLIGSLASQINIYGYSVYGASKFAIRGFWEALCMECNPYNINAICVFPADTDTPGLVKESKRKPEITKAIEEMGGYYSADEVGMKVVRAIESGKSMVTYGFFGTAIASITTGFGPHSSAIEFLSQWILMPIVKIVAVGLNFKFQYFINRKIRNCRSCA